MRQNITFFKGLPLAGFIVLVALFAPSLSYGEVPIPAAKPDLEVKVISSAGVPIPPVKPKKSQAEIKISPFEPNNKKVISASNGNLKIVEDVDSLKSKVVFSNRQARLTREIFLLQADSQIELADKNLKFLNNNILQGHILAERYLHPTAYQVSAQELKNWMEKYADHPQAKDIYNLALSLDSALVNQLKKPIKHQKISGNLSAISQQGKLYRTTKKRNSNQNARVRKLKREIDKNIKSQRLTLALNILSNDYAVQFMDNVEYDHQRALIAAGFMYAGKLDNALRLSKGSLKRSGSNVPMAGWVKGLTDWRRDDFQSAAIAFQSAASSQYASSWLKSAAAYWASRAHMRQGNTELVTKWLALSATYPRTFYGLIASRALGYESQFNWALPELNREYIKVIESTQIGKRAAALIQSGQLGLAEAELKNISFNNDVKKKRALLAYANKHNLPSLMMALGNSFSGPRGQFYDAALYPYAAWVPEEGFVIDKALIYAFIRQESRFNQRISNPSGATGLMQIMPATASHVAGNNVYKTEKGRYLLKDPALNINLGQKYIQELLNYRSVDQDLISLAVAYNAGPSNLTKWKADRSHIDDPLLFIETIPFPETRAFVERVLANYWIYKMRMEEATPSLDAVAEGKWAVRVATNN